MESTTTIAAKDGLELFIRSWAPPQYKATIALVHGFGEHSGRYQHVADFFNKNGFAIVALDLRGHGKTVGQRGHTPSNETTYDDVETFINYVQKTFGDKRPFFLYGHSMGGNFVMNTLLRRQPKGITAAVLTGPLISLSFKPNPVLMFLGKTLKKLMPTLSQPGGVNTQNLSRDKSVVTAYINDPLVHGKISAVAGMDLLDSSEFLNTYQGSVPVPTLIMHGSEDFLTSQPASEAFAKRVSGAITYRKWEGLYHEIHNEPEKEAVLNEILMWLNAHI